MDYEYYGLSKGDYEKLVGNRSAYIVDYWRKGRHFSKIKSRDKGDSARIADKNIYTNIKESFYDRQHPCLQGVFYGYGNNDFITIHLRNKYLLKIDFKSCFRNIPKEQVMAIIKKNQHRLKRPLPSDMIETIYFPYGYLQAGLSASNILSDIFFKYNFDKFINKGLYNNSEKLGEYSRYYDDLYISSDNKKLLLKIQKTIRDKAKDLMMPINNKKSYLRTLNGSKLFTSTVVDGKIRVSRYRKNNLRAAMYQFDKMDSNDKWYVPELRSLMARLEHIIYTETSPNKKYLDALEHYKEEYNRLRENDIV